MKTKLVLILVTLFGLNFMCFSQKTNNVGYKKYWEKNKDLKPSDVRLAIGDEYINPRNGKPYVIQPQPGVIYNGFIGSTTIPVTFSQIEFKDGVYRIGSPINLGAGYTWMWGKIEFNEDNAMYLEPQFFFGCAIDVGIKPNNTGDLLGGLSLNGFFGFNKVSLNIGYDVINKNTFFGLGTKIDLLVMKNSRAYTIHRIWKNPEVEAPKNN